MENEQNCEEEIEEVKDKKEDQVGEECDYGGEEKEMEKEDEKEAENEDEKEQCEEDVEKEKE